MKFTKCLHEVLSDGYRVELARGDGSIFFNITNPKKVPESGGKLHFSIDHELFENGPEDEICEIFSENYKKLKQSSEE